jgi:LDH2 family malate/lactate/ureidoglycolate dehydrogenase
MPAEDPHDAMEGVVLPMAGYKGYGLAFVNEILAAILPGATLSMDVSKAFLHEGATALDSWGIGHLAIALDVGAFEEPDVFMSRVRHLVDTARASAPASGTDRIMVPGEPEAATRMIRMEHGIPISGPVLQVLRTYADEVGIGPLPSEGQR